MFSAENNQRLLVGESWPNAEWAFVLGWLLPVLDVNQSVRGPKPLERIWHSGEVCRALDAFFGH
jgi:hypothetical protein